MKRKMIDNRYEILKKLGTGASGIVYKVRDVKDEKIIALKILSKKKTSSETVQRFKREFRLLAELHHPNLCSVYDFGILKDGRCYFTMEYIDGPNIFEFTKKLPYEKIYPVRKDISNGVYPLVVQLCRVLEYIHSKGLIHYDIKPGNILIVQNIDKKVKGNKKLYVQSAMPQAKLMDFGLAAEQQMNDGSLIRGTFPYIAPELIKGLVVDHRVDLYSLGVLLYEIFTRRSFQKGRESFVTLLKQRINRISVPPSKIVSDMPKALERLIMRLLSFEPAARFSRANEIIKEINKVSHLKFTPETAETIEGYLLSSQFVGRENEMDLLRSFYEQARRGEGRIVLITGDAGIGKSRLLREFKIFTQMKRSHTFIGYAHRDKTEPLEPFHDIFRELIDYIKHEVKRVQDMPMKLSLAVLFRTFPDLMLKHLDRNLPKLAPLEPRQEKLRTFEALSEMIRYCTSRLGELIILLEDLHWADDLSIQFLEYVGRSLEGKNIFICGTFRKEELKENEILKRMMVNLKDEGYFNQIELTPLKYRSLYSFLDSTITRSSNSSELARYLMKKTNGNPFFVEEILRALLRKKKVRIGERIELKELKQIIIPETVEDLVLKRITDLKHNSQEVVKFAAIILRDFSYDVMRQLTGLDESTLSRILWDLKKRQIMIEDGNKFELYHATLREAIIKRLGDKEKRELNYQVGKILERINLGKRERVMEDLAYYFINARDRTKGIRYGLRAAKKNSKRYANEQAILYYKGVLGLLDRKNIKLHFTILQELAQVEILAGYITDAIKHYNKTLSLKTGLVGDRIKIFSKLGNIYESKGESAKALRLYRRGLRLLHKLKPGRLKLFLEAELNVKICRTYQMIGDNKTASKFTFNTLELLKNLKGKETVKLRAETYNTMGIIETTQARQNEAHLDNAIEYYKKAYYYYNMIKEEEEMAAALHNLGVMYRWKFDSQKAYDCYKKSNQIAEKIGYQYLVSITLYNLGNILNDRGQHGEALDYFQKTLLISKKIGNMYVTGVSFLGSGICFFHLCDYKKAKEYCEKALKISHTIGWKEKRIPAIACIGNVYQAMGEYTNALRCYRQALKMSKDIEQQHGITLLLIDIGSVFIEIGEFSRAKKYITDALNLATSIGAEKVKVDCYKHLCRMSIMMKNYAAGYDLYEKGIRGAQELEMRRHLLEFSILASDMYYHEKKYMQGVKNADKAIAVAKEIGTKDLYAHALLHKVKNGVQQAILIKIEAIKFLDEAKTIAEEIGCPELLWSVYYEYGRFLQDDMQHLRALDYYEKCNKILTEVSAQIKNESYKKNYLGRSDHRLVDTAISEIAQLHH